MGEALIPDIFPGFRNKPCTRALANIVCHRLQAAAPEGANLNVIRPARTHWLPGPPARVALLNLRPACMATHAFQVNPPLLELLGGLAAANPGAAVGVLAV